MSSIPTSNRILILDDNKDIHDDFRKVLHSEKKQFEELKQIVFGEKDERVVIPDYQIDSAYQGEEGLQRVQKSLSERCPYFLVFVDIRMPPGWDGIETIEKIWKVDSDIQTVICTAYSDYRWQDMIRRVGWSDRLLILKKPFDSIEVRQIAAALHEKWHLLQQSRNKMDILQSAVDEKTAEIRATLEATTDGIVVFSTDPKIINYNDNFQQLWKDLTLNGESIESLLSRKDPSALISFISGNAENERIVRSTLDNIINLFANQEDNDTKLEIRLSNGKKLELHSRPLKLDGSIIGKVLSFRDVTEQRYFEEQLTFQATHDLLTRLPNRTLLIDRLQQAILEAKREKTEVAVIFLDLDRFKIINDTLGHNFGDELLKNVAERLLLCKRESDTLCRMGGDEFVLLIPKLHEEKFFLVPINKIREALKKPFFIHNEHVSITCSMGISFYPKNGSTPEELLKNADAAMYRAKAQGKNTFEYYTEEMNVQMKERLYLEQNLILAYKLGELLLHYQPIIDVKTRTIKGTEALLRWKHPQLGMIEPKKFISIAEETGLILPIGEWVLRTACEQNLQWQKNGLSKIPISVNLSGYQVKNIDSIKMIEKVLEETEYSGMYLGLELTENVLMESVAEVKEIFQRLRKKGVSFIIDDFGTGYSNLHYLMHYPITKLKIDKTFIESLDKDSIEAPIIKAIISMAHNLKMKVIAEGVETEEQLKFLSENQCDEVQGFFFSKPIEANAYTQLLKEGILTKNNLK